MSELWDTTSIPSERGGLISERLRKFGSAILCATTIYTAPYLAANIAEGNVNIHASASAPDMLPAAVARMANNAVILESGLVSLEASSSGSTSDINSIDLQMSGAYLGNGDFLTAGHGLKSDDNRMLPGLDVNACGGYAISGLMPSGVAFTNPANKAISEYTGNNEIDHAMFQLSKDSLESLAALGIHLDDLPEMQIAQKPPAVGETVYFINWEPTVNGEHRDPFSAESKLTKPAIYAGVVTKLQGSSVEVVTGFKSYNDGGIPADHLQAGGSGGIVLNGEGQLIGMSDVSAYDGFRSLFRRIFNFKIGPFGLPNNGKSLTFVDIVTRENIHVWERQLNASQLCPGSYVAGYPSTQNDDRLSFRLAS